MLVISATNNILGPLHPQHLPLGCLVSSCLPATPAASTWYPLYPLYKRPVLATISPLTLPLTSRCRGVLPSLRQPCCVHCPLCPPQYLIMSTVSTSVSPHVSTSDTRHSLAPRTRLLCCAARRPAASRHQQQTAHLACGRGLMRIEIHRV